MATKKHPPSSMQRLGDLWNGWWFCTADLRPLSAVRIGTGIALLLYVLSWGNAASWLAIGGRVPANVTDKVLNVFEAEPLVFRGLSLFGDSPTAVTAVQILLGTSALLLALGLFTRYVAVVSWLAFWWFAHRATLLAGGTEPALAALLFYLAWSPCGEFWSLDKWRRGTIKAVDPKTKARQELAEVAKKPLPPGWRKTLAKWLPPPAVLGNIALKMLQVHLTLLVATMAITKLQAPAWSNGEAIWYLTAQTLSRPLDLSGLRAFPLLVNLWTHGIVLVEVLFPVLVWWRLIRPAVLAAAVTAWLSLALVTGDWLFPLTMTAALAAFAPAEWWQPSVAGNRPSFAPSPETSESW